MDAVFPLMPPGDSTREYIKRGNDIASTIINDTSIMSLPMKLPQFTYFAFRGFYIILCPKNAEPVVASNDIVVQIQ